MKVLAELMMLLKDYERCLLSAMVFFMPISYSLLFLTYPSFSNLEWYQEMMLSTALTISVICITFFAVNKILSNNIRKFDIYIVFGFSLMFSLFYLLSWRINKSSVSIEYLFVFILIVGACINGIYKYKNGKTKK